MSEPEINIDQYPDSIIDKIVQNQPKKVNIINENNLTNDQKEELNSTDIFIANKNEVLVLNQEALKSFKEQKILVSNIAKLNFEDSKINAEKADSILINLESEENIELKNSNLELAAEFNAKSMILNQQSNNAITLSKKIDLEISKLEEEINIISKLQSKDDLASNNNYDLKIIESINESLEDPSKKDNPTFNNINDQVSNLEFRQNSNNIELVQQIDLDKIRIDNNTVKTNLIEKNKPQLGIIKIDSAKISNELFDSSNVNNDLAVNSNVNSNESSSVKSEETKFLIEDKKTVEFIDNLPIDIPMVKSVEKIPSQTINGITFSPEDEPENYEVTSLADPDIDFIQDNYENKINNKIIEINIKDIDKIRALSSQLDSLRIQKLDLSTEKEISKIDKQIKKILKTRAKTELKVVDDMAYVNENEINHLFREISSLKKQQGNEDSPNFKSKQAQEYEKAANDLFVESKLLREKASLDSDTSYFLTEFKIHKVDLIEHAIKNENTAIKYLSKSKELYAESLTEGFSDDIISIAKSISTQQKKQSVRLEELSEISMNESVEYSKKAIFFEEEGDILKSKEYEDLAEIQKNKSISYKQESLNYKKKESNLVQDIEISNSLVDSQSLEIASTKDFKSYYEFQKAIKNLDLESQKLNYKNQSYIKLSQQMNAKADALEQKSKLESDPVTKNELLKLSNSFKNQAKINKELSNALVVTMDSVKREIKSKQMSQALILDMMSSNEKTQIKALAISGKADSILSILSNDKLTEISDSISSDSISLDSTYFNLTNVDSMSNQGLVLEDSISSTNSKNNVEVTSNGSNFNNILSKDFIPPVVIDENIFIFTQKQVYSDANPIPFNPKIPKGLIFKVQVGAFRNPIPQDLFKGFAPISAENVRGDITRYRVGYFKTFESANKAKNQIRLLGYSDAFVVSINNGERIKLNEARNIQQSDPSIDISSNSIINSNASENNKLSDLRTKIANDNSLASVITVDQIKGVFFSVQIGAFSKPLTKENSYNISPLIVSKVNNLYKYSTGEYKSIEFALIKKADLINDNILPDAFIIAYKNGVKISLDQARSSNPNRAVVYENPIIYYIDFGTYPVYKKGQFIGEPLPNTDFPEKLNEENSGLRDLNIKSRSRFGGKQFFSKKFNSLSDAQKALNLIENLDISNAQILKSKRDDFAFNYEYKIEISNPNSNDDTFISKVDKLKNLAFKDAGENIYYSKSRDDYESATTDLNACKSQNLEDSRIIVFKNGVETNLEQTLKNFK
ncbi:MAG: SPOR domain-containing protein [Flavobacteriales bacterium]|nr:SPOR domain-containing protein [Flavobacteriales bacterium]